MKRVILNGAGESDQTDALKGEELLCDGPPCRGSTALDLPEDTRWHLCVQPAELTVWKSNYFLHQKNLFILL